MATILTLVIGFILTTVAGNRLIQHWQQRGWVRQQRFLGEEKEYMELRALSAELSSETGARLYHMKRLLWAVRSSSMEAVEERLKLYDERLTRWNESLGTFYVRLTLYATYSYTNRLESRIHSAFTQIGGQLEKAVRKRREGGKVVNSEMAKLERSLNALEGESFNFNRDLLAFVQRTKRRVYFGTRISYSEGNLYRFSLWELIKALFVRDVDSHSISRSAADIS